jgi:hypothetical protein
MTENSCGKHAAGTCNGYGTECSPRHTPEEIMAHRAGQRAQAMFEAITGPNPKTDTRTPADLVAERAAR